MYGILNKRRNSISKVFGNGWFSHMQLQRSEAKMLYSTFDQLVKEGYVEKWRHPERGWVYRVIDSKPAKIRKAIKTVRNTYKCRLDSFEERFGAEIVDGLIEAEIIEIYEAPHKFVVAGQVYTTDKINYYVRLVK